VNASLVIAFTTFTCHNLLTQVDVARVWNVSKRRYVILHASRKLTSGNVYWNGRNLHWAKRQRG